MTSPTLRRAAALAGSLALLALLPAAASAAGNPQVVRVDPTTGVVKQLAGGAPFTHLGGLAFGPTGTLYVANQGPVGPSPRGAGIYARRPPTYAVASIASGTAPAAVVASGGTLYSLDSDRVVAIDGTTGAERTVTAGGLYDAYGVDPAFGAVSGNTLYTTASSSCDSAEGGGGYVIAIDTTTGAQTLVKAFGCHALGGIATTPGGMLTVAVGGRPAKIVQLDPQSGAVTTLSSGGSLKTPKGLALDAAGDVLVADSTSGVIAVWARRPAVALHVARRSRRRDRHRRRPRRRPLRQRGGRAAEARGDRGRPAAAQRLGVRSHGALQPGLHGRLLGDGLGLHGLGLHEFRGVPRRTWPPQRPDHAAPPGAPRDRDRAPARQEGQGEGRAHAAGPAQRLARQAHHAPDPDRLTGCSRRWRPRPPSPRAHRCPRGAHALADPDALHAAQR